jgi:hypothetical protein
MPCRQRPGNTEWHLLLAAWLRSRGEHARATALAETFMPWLYTIGGFYDSTVALGAHGAWPAAASPWTPLLERTLDEWRAAMRAADSVLVTAGRKVNALKLVSAAEYAEFEGWVLGDVAKLDPRPTPCGELELTADAIRRMEGKRVLLVSPFAPLLVQRWGSGAFARLHAARALWPDLDRAPALAACRGYRCATTFCNRGPDADAGATLERMWAELRPLLADADAVWLGCGTYGIALAHRIAAAAPRADVVYVGGELQVLFGVLGHRWRTTEFTAALRARQRIAADDDALLERPPAEYTPQGVQLEDLEFGAYF